MQADPGTIPIFTTYFLHATLGGDPTPAQVRAYMPLFKARVNAMAAGIDRRPAVVLLELDGIGSTGGIVKTGALPEWEAALRFEMNAMQRLPHTVVYVEGGYSDSNSVGYTARVLKAIGIHHIRGFFTNDTHNNWTINEDRWATAVARRVGGTHFIVNTAVQRPRPEAQPASLDAGRRGSLQPARAGPRHPRHDRHRSQIRRCLPVGAHSGQQQRLWGRPVGRNVLAAVRGGAGGARQQPARSRPAEQAVLSTGRPRLAWDRWTVPADPPHRRVARPSSRPACSPPPSSGSWSRGRTSRDSPPASSPTTTSSASSETRRAATRCARSILTAVD